MPKFQLLIGQHRREVNIAESIDSMVMHNINVINLPQGERALPILDYINLLNKQLIDYQTIQSCLNEAISEAHRICQGYYVENHYFTNQCFWPNNESLMRTYSDCHYGGVRAGLCYPNVSNSLNNTHIRPNTLCERGRTMDYRQTNVLPPMLMQGRDCNQYEKSTAAHTVSSGGNANLQSRGLVKKSCEVELNSGELRKSANTVIRSNSFPPPVLTQDREEGCLKPYRAGVKRLASETDNAPLGEKRMVCGNGIMLSANKIKKGDFSGSTTPRTTMSSVGAMSSLPQANNMASKQFAP